MAEFKVWKKFQVNYRKNQIHNSIYRIAKVVQDLLKEVETQEPRFISTLVETNGRYEGVGFKFANLKKKC